MTLKPARYGIPLRAWKFDVLYWLILLTPVAPAILVLDYAQRKMRRIRK